MVVVAFSKLQKHVRFSAELFEPIFHVHVMKDFKSKRKKKGRKERRKKKQNAKKRKEKKKGKRKL